MLRRETLGGESLWPVLHWFLLVVAVLTLPGSLPPPAPLSLFSTAADRPAAAERAGPAQRLASQLTSLSVVESVLTASLASTDRYAPYRYTAALRDPKLRAVASLALPTEKRLKPTGEIPELATLAALAERHVGPDRRLEQARTHPARTNVVTEFSFPKWTGAKERYWAHDPSFASICAEILSADCGLADWRGFLDRVAGSAPADQLALVNRWVNRVPYRADEVIWGQRDYWAAPGEFLATGGDCEDYAITKYYSLKDLGFPEEAMRIVVLNDKRRRQPHAVLVVTWQGQDLVLDSLDRRIRPWDEVRHYHAVYSFNEAAYWLHSGRQISKI